MRELEEMRAFRRCQAERTRQTLEERLRSVNVPPLLEPRVPTHAHVGQTRDLFATQAERAATRPLGQPHVGRTNPCTTATEELRELGTCGHGDESPSTVDLCTGLILFDAAWIRLAEATPKETLSFAAFYGLGSSTWTRPLPAPFLPGAAPYGHTSATSSGPYAAPAP